MNNPLLIVITGRPASGKTTLAHIISKEINCPLFSRDAFKEGYINTTGIPHGGAGNQIDWHIYETFFQTIDLLISKDISIIIEAAFQHKLWQPKLSALQHKADVKIIICQANSGLTKNRFNERFLNNPGRKKFHGDEHGEKLIDTYEPVNMDAPTLFVDTTENYNPGIEEIIGFISKNNSRCCNPIKFVIQKHSPEI